MKTFNDPDFNGIRGKNPSFSLLFFIILLVDLKVKYSMLRRIADGSFGVVYQMQNKEISLEQKDRNRLPLSIDGGGDCSYPKPILYFANSGEIVIRLLETLWRPSDSGTGDQRMCTFLAKNFIFLRRYARVGGGAGGW